MNMQRTRKDNIKSLLLLLFALFSTVFGGFGGNYAEAATSRFYIVGNTPNIAISGAGSTNLPIGNNSTLGAANGKYITTLSLTAPGASDGTTNMQEAYTPRRPADPYYLLGTAYYNSAFATDATIAANATGVFQIKSSRDNDRFLFQLIDYNPATNATTVIGTASYVTATAGVITAKNITFNNAVYTLVAGHYIAVAVRYYPNSDTSYTGYLYCNKNYQSYINVDIKFPVSASASVNGQVSAPGTTTATSVNSPVVTQLDFNSSKTYTVTADPGYNISSVSVDGAIQPAASGLSSWAYAFNNINRSHTISADFVGAINTFTIQPSAGGHITVDCCPAIDWIGPNTYNYGLVTGTYVFTAEPYAGYSIGEIYVNGVAQGVPGGQVTPYPITLTLPATTSLAVDFIPYIDVISSVSGVGGTISPLGTTPVPRGQDITFDITPDAGYRILSITDNGTYVGNTTPYTISNVQATHDVVVTFKKTYTIQAIAGANGTISPIGDVIVDSGSDRNFSITPNFGYRVSDVLVDGSSVGALSAYSFTNVTADHVISVSFVDAPVAATYCAVPAFISTAAPPNVMLMLSVESPMEGAANPTVTCTGTPSSLSFKCNSSGLGSYDNTRNYYGYFENTKCYTYSGSAGTGLFSPSGPATNHQCAAGTAWSGNMLNWSTMLAVDAFRKAFTGGNRAVDTTTDTVLLAATNDGSWFPVRPRVDNAELYMPVAGAGVTRYIKRQGAGSGFGVCAEGFNDCTVTRSATSGEAQWPVAGANTEAVYSLRIKACDSTGGVESRCNSTTNKPEGTIQKYMDKMRFALMSYSSDSSQNRDGGVLREKMKWVSPKVPYGMKYHDASNNVVTCTTTSGCTNPEKEVNTDGTFVNNPDGAGAGNSGLINYINKFAYTSGYKGSDPAAEMYYEVVRYFKNLTPSGSRYCTGLAEPNDGFPLYCNASKTNARGWRDPTLYSCSQNFVVAINDANPWLDKRIPGSAFKANYGGTAAGGSDWCGAGSASGVCDADFLDGATQINVEEWTNKVGDHEGLTGTTINVACEVDNTGVCIGGFSGGGKNVVVSKLGRIIGTPPYPAKENSYNMAGLAYYAHSVDLRPDLPSTGKIRNLTTYMIDTQEPGGNMLVGPKNMLQLSAKYGGFEDKNNDQEVTIEGKKYNSPYKNATCGGVSATPDTLCSEWDADNDGWPDNYFFASDSAKVETGLYKAFASILNRATSGTAAAVANNRSGERGANIIQALFYPQWPSDMSIKWLGDVQALWFYMDPIVKFSGIFEDSDENKELNLAIDLPPGNDATTLHALWKAGELLHSRTAASRSIYTLLPAASTPYSGGWLAAANTDLTNTVNAFTAANVSLLKPLMDLATETDTKASEYINYTRGVDGGINRSRTVTNKSLTSVWKLGDIINSTPQIQSGEALNQYNLDYFDSTYADFVKTSAYTSNNYVYAGSNDGMLHAFQLGKVQKINNPNNVYQIASLKLPTDDIGKEEWAYIPTNVLPYLKNCADANYCHQYLIDGTPLLVDASINKPGTCGASNYWDCKRTALSWETVLVGSMGLGGATRDGNCNETLNPDADPGNNIDCIKAPVAGNGFSSYFALDVTTPLSPKYMWEFSDAAIQNDPTLTVVEKANAMGLGVTTSGAAIIRISTKNGVPLEPTSTTNGRWFAVFASGPTGTIETASRQFLGRSDQNLKIYVVDLNASGGFKMCKSAGQANCNYWVIDTGKKYAFAGSIGNGVIDIDKRAAESKSFYSDDIVYIPYTKATLTSGYPTAWDKGGVLRLVTRSNPDPSTGSDPDPANWFVTDLIDNIGPVTRSVDIIKDKTKHKLWVYFGEGRYFFNGDDLSTRRKIYGIADPCYSYDLNHLDILGNDTTTCPAVTETVLKDQTSTPKDKVDPASYKGWYIDLAAADNVNGVGAERMTGGVSAKTSGVVMYSTMIPNTDLCVAGGTPSQWAVDYSSGGVPPARAMQGKVIMTTSGQPVAKAINISDVFTGEGGRKLDSAISNLLKGLPPQQPLPTITLPAPSKRILNIQER